MPTLQDLGSRSMSNPYLPQEILDYIIDLLHNKPNVLKQCSLVSKSWVPRTRKHIFADITLRYPHDITLWKRTFPDIANSPAHHARFLFVGCPRIVTAADGEEGGWIRSFSGVTSLDVDGGDQHYDGLGASEVSLSPFRELSPTLKSLHLGPILLPYPGLFDFILSFPLLEDLALTGFSDSQFNGDGPHRQRTVIPPTSPPLTGTLGFYLHGGAGNVARQLLDLPNGLHFRRLGFSRSHETDLWWIVELVTMCSHTLESLDVSSHRTFTHTHDRPDNLTLFKLARSQAHSASRRQRNSATWSFDL